VPKFDIGFWEKRQFFRWKLSKIAVNCLKSPKIVIITSTPGHIAQDRLWKQRKWRVKNKTVTSTRLIVYFQFSWVASRMLCEHRQKFVDNFPSFQMTKTRLDVIFEDKKANSKSIRSWGYLDQVQKKGFFSNSKREVYFIVLKCGSFTYISAKLLCQYL
jgi:hypothetical protein